MTKKNGEKKIMPSKGQIYHKKYLFVNKDYTGFDIEVEKKRAEFYDNMLKKHPDKKIKSKNILSVYFSNVIVTFYLSFIAFTK